MAAGPAYDDTPADANNHPLPIMRLPPGRLYPIDSRHAWASYLFAQSHYACLFH